ncbi:unnamed protein product, partial [Ectocarpus sp. 13 AM-2016]
MISWVYRDFSRLPRFQLVFRCTFSTYPHGAWIRSCGAVAETFNALHSVVVYTSTGKISIEPPPATRTLPATNRSQDVVPNFFTDEYHHKVCAAFKRVDGMALPTLLGGRVFSALFCEVFSEELGIRSEKLVEGVKDFMQDVLGKLCDHTCAAHPVLLNELKTNLVEQFVDSKEASAKSAVENVVKGELGWVFTQDRSYEDTMRDVREMASRVRKSKVEHEATAGTDSQTIFELAKDVGTIPEAFI